jgi:hypothetical protein
MMCLVPYHDVTQVLFDLETFEGAVVYVEGVTESEGFVARGM